MVQGSQKSLHVQRYWNASKEIISIIIDPLGRPTVPVSSDHDSNTFCPSVRPSVQPLFFLIFHCRFPGCYQYNKLSRQTVEEYWDPKSEEYDALKVVREIPAIFIALSKEPLEGNDEMQVPMNKFLDFDGEKNDHHRKRRKRGSKKAAQELGMNRESKIKNCRKNNNKNFTENSNSKEEHSVQEYGMNRDVKSNNSRKNNSKHSKENLNSSEKEAVNCDNK